MGSPQGPIRRIALQTKIPGWQLSTIEHFRSVSFFTASNFTGEATAILLCAKMMF
jgi:hypothetical protein